MNHRDFSIAIPGKQTDKKINSKITLLMCQASREPTRLNNWGYTRSH